MINQTQLKMPIQQPNFDVFISYSHIDKEWASKLRQDLSRYDLTVWIDNEQIRPGSFIVSALEKATAQCKAIALITSPQSLHSGWVNEEYNRAINLINSERSEVQLIPLILRDVELPAFLKSRLFVDFRSNENYAESVCKLVWGITGIEPKQVIYLESIVDQSSKTIDNREAPRNKNYDIGEKYHHKPKHPLTEKILNDVRDIIALHGLDDGDWAKAVSGQYFLVGIGDLLNMNEQEDYRNLLNKFLSSFSFQIDGIIVFGEGHLLVTPEETKKIVDHMREEDEQDNFYTRTARMRYENINSELLHHNYLYGLAVKISGASQQYKIMQEVHQHALDKLIYGRGYSPLDSYGGWQPYRVPWVTARILISLKRSSYESREDASYVNDIINKALDSLIRRIYQGTYWRSGVGDWVTKWESTGLCLEALEEWGYIAQCKSEVRKVIRYVLEHQSDWLVDPPDFTTESKSNQTLSAVILISVISTISESYFGDEEFSEDYERYIRYLERCTIIIASTINPVGSQFCTIPQIAYYTVRALAR